MVHGRRRTAETLAISAVLAVALAAGCWPLDYSEDDAVLYTSAAAGGAGGIGGEGGRAGAPPVTDLFVDPVGGSDEAPGTQDRPFRTLMRALSVAQSGQNVHLFSGICSAESGEDFATQVPDGVSVTAVVPGEVVLRGTGVETALDFAGGGAARDLRIENFGTGVAAADATTLAGLEISGTVQAVVLTGSAEVTLTESIIADGYSGVELRGFRAIFASLAMKPFRPSRSASTKAGRLAWSSGFQARYCTAGRKLAGTAMTGAEGRPMRRLSALAAVYAPFAAVGVLVQIPADIVPAGSFTSCPWLRCKPARDMHIFRLPKL